MIPSDAHAYLMERTKIGHGAGCWLWKLSTGSHGYGQAWDGTTVLLAHRFAYETWVGPIPIGLTVDHVCRVRRCVNPRHLRLLTNLDNASDNGQVRKTHCPRGHEYNEANTYVRANGHRVCRVCPREKRRSTRVELGGRIVGLYPGARTVDTLPL